MFLSIATTHEPATDLGYLLHKHPDRLHEMELPFGKSLLFYPEATAERCEAALVLDVDPVALVRRKGFGDAMQDHYVNDRPYAASSFLSVAIARQLRTAVAGTSKERPELAESDIPLEVRVVPLPAHGGENLVRQLFEPLGWSVDVEPVAGPGANSGRYVSLHLMGRTRLSRLLAHLYVLIPVLDDDKHYWVGEDEVAKLLRRGEGWLEGHPSRDLIVRRYLVHQRSLTRAALARLVPDLAEAEDGGVVPSRAADEDALEAPIRLHDRRLDMVVKVLEDAKAETIADLGCGEGKLLARLVGKRWVSGLVGVDASTRALEYAAKRLKLDGAGSPKADRVMLLHSALTYRDRRWAHADAATLVEVIEHLDPDRLPALERIVFGDAKPRTVVVTTPNAEHNVLFPGMNPGAFRHPDHRFEWTRAEFRAWTKRIEDGFGYAASLSDIGDVHPGCGPPTQMAVFTR